MSITIKAAVGNVYASAVELGMDVSPTDVGFIIGSFLQCVIDDPEPMPDGVTEFLQLLADEANAVKDE